MAGEAILFLYVGAVGAIFLLNIFQWFFSRDWIYGVFTFQTFIWCLYAFLQRVYLSETSLSTAEFLAIHVAVHGLAQIAYLELVDCLFDVTKQQPRLKRWFRGSQLLALGYPVVNMGLLILIGESWPASSANVYLATVYWLLLVSNCGIGIWLSVRHRSTVGGYFLLGSILLMLHEINSLGNYIGPFYPAPTTEAGISLAKQILGGGLILELMSFSIALVLRQRQLAVAQAVEQTRLEAKLVQERLEAELAVRWLEKEKTDAQLRAMQAQVNPHFLFNSLNSLSSLIEEEPQRASQFVDQLSMVYRYLLRANDQQLATLSSELEFIRSYFHLLKTRHGDGLSITIRVNPEAMHQLLPPLTLQLLVENAVKHNVISLKKPLTIEILGDETGYLTVRNNLQRKVTRILSNGVGLTTITAYYQKFDHPAPLLTEEDGYFSVTLPLIASSADWSAIEER
ncbi:sensor histidine kinase [Larkinella bovis]|uniref:Sensor histidine kinase n=1 Tax=Larkinella bovis TaxID=683041 RepID=A0ABW0IIX3_9BACT